MPDVNETLLLRVTGEDVVSITVQEGIYSFQPGGSDSLDNVVEISRQFLVSAVNGTEHVRTIWTSFAEPKDDAMVKKGNGASMIPLIQSMKKAYAQSKDIQVMVDEVINDATREL